MTQTNQTDRPVECWTCDREAEGLCGSVREAVEEYLVARYEPIDGSPPETVTVYGFARMVPDAERLAEWQLENLLENLDNEYSNWRGDATKPTDAMKAAARTFVAAVLAEYQVWACEHVTTETVRVRDYIDDADGDA